MLLDRWGKSKDREQQPLLNRVGKPIAFLST